MLPAAEKIVLMLEGIGDDKMPVDLMLPAAEKIVLMLEGIGDDKMLEGIGDDKIRVNSSSLDHLLVILPDRTKSPIGGSP